jgi:hypothetical protein
MSALVAIAVAIPLLASAPSPAQPATQPPSQPAPADPAPVLTEAVGLLAGLQLYQTYLNIGMLADIRAEGLYEAGELAQLLGSVVTPLEQVDKQLEKVAAIKTLSKDDVAALARMRKIVALLHTEGKSLQAFWDTGVEDHAKKYEAARQAAWKELDALLELDPKKEIAPQPKSVEIKP